MNLNKLNKLKQMKCQNAERGVIKSVILNCIKGHSLCRYMIRLFSSWADVRSYQNTFIHNHTHNNIPYTQHILFETLYINDNFSVNI